MMRTLIVTACLAALAGCGEREQTKTSENTNRSDTAAWQGAKNAYNAPGWTVGNQGSWENQIRARGQLQNEYVKTN